MHRQTLPMREILVRVPGLIVEGVVNLNRPRGTGVSRINTGRSAEGESETFPTRVPTPPRRKQLDYRERAKNARRTYYCILCAKTGRDGSEYARRDSNPQPLGPKPRALSS